MKLAYFHTGLHLILDNVPCIINRIIETGECHLERKSDAGIMVRRKSDLLESFFNGDLIIEGKEFSEGSRSDIDVDLSGLDEGDRKAVLRKYHYVKIAEELLGETPTKTKLDKAIEAASKKIDDTKPPGVSSVYRWWRKWLDNHNDILALVNRSRGPKGSWKIKGTVEQIINESIDEIYLNRQKNVAIAAYENVIAKIDSLNAIRDVQLKKPSRTTFYRMIEKLDKYDVTATREGKRAADTLFNAVGKGVNPTNILERVEVDHTPIDLMVFNPSTGKADGRPTLTVLIDRYSRMIMGFEVGFEPPSELSVMRALRNSILPSLSINKEYPDIKHEWPAFGKPHTLICDNGMEFHSHQLRRMCWELDIDLQFCPGKQPNYKGSVERFIGTLNGRVSHRIPGTTFSNIKQRGDYDSVKEARITLSDLKELITYWIVSIYNQTTHKSTQRTPHKMWIAGLDRVEPILPESKEKLDLILTSEDKRVLTEKGIEFKGLFYNSAELSFFRRFKRSSNKVKFRYDKEDIGFVWVYDEFNGNYLKVYSIDPDYAEGLSLRQHLQIRHEAREQGKSDQDSKELMQSKEAFRKKIEKKSSHKLLRERKKAARDNSDKLQSTDLQSVLNTVYVNEDWDLQEVPEFQVTGKGI